MDTNFCSYCKQGNENGSRACAYCGAPFGDESLRDDYRLERCEPMFYNGYMLWPEREWGFQNDIKRIYFWLGDRLVETIELNMEIIRQFVKEGESCLPLFWDLFCLTQDQEEVMRIRDQNVASPALFEIKAVRPPQYSFEQIAEIVGVNQR